MADDFVYSFRRQKVETKNEKLVWIILVATISAAAFGFLIEECIKLQTRSPKLIVLSLVFFSLPLLVAEVFGKKNKTLEQMDIKQGFLIGLAQAIALIPGVSRSGITISTGMLLNFKRKDSAYFVFLLSMPIILAASLKKIWEVAFSPKLIADLNPFLIGILFAFISSFLVIKYFLKYLARSSLYPFISRKPKTAPMLRDG